MLHGWGQTRAMFRPRFVAEQIPDAGLHVFASDAASSHFPFLENPTAFNAVVEKFLAKEPEPWA
ncbi:hypothetical protein NGF19_29895 [Streptomyces sp. RY43-2]|uniref:Alpha/beta hydrolase n=1 Tax=Streptomyces macrolidinus TaxID=2952607 RepID=A0ABT0ZMX6_9ACTN|nr:hypothetical protein [Streptomyces macrolidinus]MCN9244947.1 hypothetical protein [Streptomyces macrolidinus]